MPKQSWMLETVALSGQVLYTRRAIYWLRQCGDRRVVEEVFYY